MSTQGTSRHVLILSDAEEIQQMLREFLEEEGYEVTSQAYLTGEVEAVTRQSPDAILIDCNRKELEESVEFLKQIRLSPHLRDTPIVACTSAVRIIDDYLPALDEMSVHVIKKPFDIDVLANVIANNLASQQTASS